MNTRRRRIFLVAICAILLVAGCSGRVAETDLDLSGQWSLELHECLPGETACRESLSAIGREHRVVVPDNLHRRFPTFFGRATIRRDFNFSGSGNLALLLGGVGSVDRVYINGILIGDTGTAPSTYQGTKSPRFASAWNVVRLYRIAPRVLKSTSVNRLRIEFHALDVKAGLHRGPAVLGRINDLRPRYFLYRLLYEEIFRAETVLLFFCVLYFVSVWRMRRRSHGFEWLLAAFVCYTLHSFYYIYLPFDLPRLEFLKLQWILRMGSAVFASVFYFYVAELRLAWQERGILAFGLVGSLAALAAPTLHAYMIVVQWTQFLFIFQVLLQASTLIFLRNDGNKEQAVSIAQSGIPIMVVYVSEWFVRMYWSNLPWIYHYMALVNVMAFLRMYSESIYQWKARADRLEQDLIRQRVHLARDLHDSLGSYLTEIIMQTTPDSRPSVETLNQLGRTALEELRETVGLLRRAPEDVPALAKVIQEHSERINSLGRVSIDTDVDESTPGDSAEHFRVDLHFRRIYGEWMTNVLRHSRPKKIHVRLRSDSRGTTLLIADDGAGLSWRGDPVHSGLAHIAERTRLIGGTVRSLRLKEGNVFICRRRV